MCRGRQPGVLCGQQVGLPVLPGGPGPLPGRHRPRPLARLPGPGALLYSDRLHCTAIQLKYKLYERRAKCLLLLGQFDKAKTEINSAKKSFEAHKGKLDEKKQNQAVKSLKEVF